MLSKIKQLLTWCLAQINYQLSAIGTTNFILVLILLLATVVRLVGISSLPPAPYWEEVALGYDAYSLAQTGKDHHGNSWPISAFESFGDWKPSGYFYALVPIIKIFGLSVFTIRLPAVIAGVFIVWLCFEITKLLFDRSQIPSFLICKNNNSKQKAGQNHALALLVAFLASISPWAIIFSRSAWEVNLATAFLLGAIYCALLFLKKKQLFFYAGHLFFLVLATYTYHSTRIIAPLVGAYFLLVIIKRALFFKNLKLFLIMFAFCLLSLSPLFLSLSDPAFKIRYAQTNIFTDLSLIEESNRAKEALGNSLYARLAYHRYWYFAKAVATNFLKHLDLDFLFISGDHNPRHSIQYVGQLYHLEFIFIVFGASALLKLFKKNKLAVSFLLAYLLMTIFPASLTKATPHALRILPSLPVWLITIALGIEEIYLLIKQIIKNQFLKKYFHLTFVLVIFFVYLLEFSYFYYSYWQVYRFEYQMEWQYGYQQMVKTVNHLQDNYQHYPIFISREQGRPAMYYWFFSQTDPKKVQLASLSAKKDQGEFLEFEQIKFINGIAEINQLPAIVVLSEKLSQDYLLTNSLAKLLKDEAIKDLNQQTVWRIMVLE